MATIIPSGMGSDLTPEAQGREEQERMKTGQKYCDKRSTNNSEMNGKKDNKKRKKSVRDGKKHKKRKKRKEERTVFVDSEHPDT
jgi:hypothetical protein